MQSSNQAIGAFDSGSKPVSEADPDDALELIDTEAACAIVGGTKPIHRSTLWRLVKAKKLPPPNKLKRWERRSFIAAVRALIDEAA